MSPFPKGGARGETLLWASSLEKSHVKQKVQRGVRQYVSEGHLGSCLQALCGGCFVPRCRRGVVFRKKNTDFVAFPSQRCLPAGRQLGCMQQSSKPPESVHPSEDFKKEFRVQPDTSSAGLVNLYFRVLFSSAC